MTSTASINYKFLKLHTEFKLPTYEHNNSSKLVICLYNEEDEEIIINKNTTNENLKNRIFDEDLYSDLKIDFLPTANLIFDLKNNNSSEKLINHFENFKQLSKNFECKIILSVLKFLKSKNILK